VQGSLTPSRIFSNRLPTASLGRESLDYHTDTVKFTSLFSASILKPQFTKILVDSLSSSAFRDRISQWQQDMRTMVRRTR
jgi:hypothetical protein